MGSHAGVIKFPKQACPEGVLADLRVTRGMPPSSVWNSAVFVDKNSFFLSAGRISRELRGSPKAGRVFVDENSLFRFAVRILRISREKSVSGWLICVLLEKKRVWMAGFKGDEGGAALVGLEFRCFCG